MAILATCALSSDSRGLTSTSTQHTLKNVGIQKQHSESKIRPYASTLPKKKKKNQRWRSQQHGMYLLWWFYSKVWKLHNQNQARECFREVCCRVFATSCCHQKQRSKNNWHHVSNSSMCISSVNDHHTNDESQSPLHFFSLLYLQPHQKTTPCDVTSVLSAKLPTNTTKALVCPLPSVWRTRQSRTLKTILAGCVNTAIHEPRIFIKKQLEIQTEYDWL